MATLTTVSEPKYNLELNQVELRVLAALVGNTSGTTLSEALEREYSPNELNAVSTLWMTLDTTSAKEGL
jgi:hypothetical protein